jgi:hypothetical protein
MERYGRANEGSNSDPTPDWTVAGGDTSHQGHHYIYILNFIPFYYFIFFNFRFVKECNGEVILIFDFVNVAGYGLVGGESYPQRPDEADCIYYLRTGFCGYGSRCRFNHPRDRGAVIF